MSITVVCMSGWWWPSVQVRLVAFYSGRELPSLFCSGRPPPWRCLDGTRMTMPPLGGLVSGPTDGRAGGRSDVVHPPHASSTLFILMDVVPAGYALLDCSGGGARFLSWLAQCSSVALVPSGRCSSSPVGMHVNLSSVHPPSGSRAKTIPIIDSFSSFLCIPLLFFPFLPSDSSAHFHRLPLASPRSLDGVMSAFGLLHMLLPAPPAHMTPNSGFVVFLWLSLSNLAN